MAAKTKMKMVIKNGKKVPAFAADGKGKKDLGKPKAKMKNGGMTKKKKGYAKGGAMMKKKGMARGGAMMKKKKK